MSLGEDGFLRIAQEVMETAVCIQEGVKSIPGVCVLGQPHMTALAIASTDTAVDILAVADVLEERYGWKMERQQRPPCLHCSVMPHHTASWEAFIAHLDDAVAIVRASPDLRNKGTAAMYGMVAKMPDASLVDDFLVTFMSEMYST